jgi:hypothetical protein
MEFLRVSYRNLKIGSVVYERENLEAGPLVVSGWFGRCPIVVRNGKAQAMKPERLARVRKTRRPRNPRKRSQIRALLVGNHPWRDHAGAIVGHAETVYGRWPIVRIDDGSELDGAEGVVDSACVSAQPLPTP